MTGLLRKILVCCFAVLAIADAGAETVMVEMRDGLKLATDVYVPAEGGPAFPVLLIRTTYGRERHAGDGERFNKQGIALVAQDVRGRGGSEGVDMAFGDDGWGKLQDGADTVAWIKAQPWCNGKIGTLGGSALGITQVMLAGASKDITCQAIVVAASNFYDQVAYQGGVWRKRLSEGWLEAQKSSHVVEVWQAHPTYDDFWKERNAEARAPEITAPALHVGGWFDIFGKGTLNNFTSRQYHGGEGARGNQLLVIGPWPHGPRQDFGDIKLRDNYLFDFNGLQTKFFQHWLLGTENGVMDGPAVHYYTLGDCGDPNAPGNEWRTANDWPPFETELTPLYLNADGTLSAAAPSTDQVLSYEYDPADPCPTHGGANLLLPAGPFDQRKVSGRKDVLKFATAPLDAPVEVTGAVSVTLYVSSDAPDTDFTAKFIDVYPDGKEILLTDNIQRVKFRNGFEKADPLPPGEVGRVTIDLWSTSIVFNRGHRIGVQISSSNYPRFEKNPNTGDDFPKDGNLRPARNTIHMAPAHPSALMVPVRK